MNQPVVELKKLSNENNKRKRPVEITLVHYDIVHRIKNPFVIIIAVSKYNNYLWKSLPGVQEDINMMRELWRTTLGYETRILTECTLINNEKYDEEHLFCSQNHITQFLEYKCLRYVKDQKEKDFDGLICIVSGHGLQDSFIASDGKDINIKEDLFVPFNARKVTPLAEMPKIYIFDACRGELHPDIVDGKTKVKGITNYRFISSNVESDYRISYATTEGKNAPVRIDGGAFIQPFYEIMMHLHRNELFNQYHLQSILQMSSRKAKIQNSQKLCPVHEDYTHYKILFHCNNEEHKHQESNDESNVAPLSTISLLDFNRTHSQYLAEQYRPTYKCCKKLKECLHIQVDDNDQEDCPCGCVIL